MKNEMNIVEIAASQSTTTLEGLGSYGFSQKTARYISLGGIVEDQEFKSEDEYVAAIVSYSREFKDIVQNAIVQIEEDMSMEDEDGEKLRTSDISILRDMLRWDWDEAELAKVVSFLPSCTPKDGEHYGDRVAYLHYVTGGCDYYIVARNREPQQKAAFGIVDDDVMSIGDTINLFEVLRSGGILDLEWKPTSVKDIVLRSSSF